LQNINVSNGSILGDVRAQSIGTIRVTNGSIGTASKATSITTSQGGIDRIQVTGGDLIANVSSAAQIDRLVVRRGEIAGNVVAGSYIGQVQADGAISGAVVAAGSLGRVMAGSLSTAVISAGWNIGRVQVKGNVTDSMILAGYDVGSDAAVGGGDDHRATGSLHSGNIDLFDVRGRMSGSTVSAGVDPTDPDTQATGSSVISRVNVRGGFGPAGSQFLAESGMDSRFYAAAQANPMVEVPTGFISEVKNGAGTDFGPGTAAGNKLVVGDLALTLTSGRANYDPGTGILVLEATTARSNLTLQNKGGTPVTITIECSDDSALANLKVVGNIILGDATVDGPVRTLTAGQVAAGATWQLPGGVMNVRMETPGDLSVTAGEIRNWHVRGAFSGNLTADAIKTAKFDSAMTGNLTALLGDAQTVQVLGGDFSGVAEVLGESKLVMVRSGNFTGSYRTGGDLRNFKVNRGDFSGVLCVGGELRTLMANRGQMSGRAWAGGEIRTVNLGSMNGGLVASSNDLRTVNIKGDMTDSYLFAGFNPGDAGYGAISGELGNLEIDAFSAGDDAAQIDVVGGGNIHRVNIRGSMIRSTISAAVGPGLDGYVGTADDVVAGAGTVGRVRVNNAIVGTAVAGESYGVFAAGDRPTVVFYGRQPFLSYGNAHAAGLATTAGNLAVTGVTQTEAELIITFNHGIRFDADSIKALITILASDDTEFVVGEDTDLWDYLYDPVYDAATCTITLTLTPDVGLWSYLSAAGLGDKIQLTIDGTPDGDPAGMDALRDNRGFVLDGEFYGVLPTGNGVQGGDFVYTIGRNVLEGVPSYEWWYGCVPTAAGMLVGYYDGLGYDDLIEGDASTQTDEVNEAIASSGDGIYECTRYGHQAILVEGTPGTGHIPDYALYDGYDDFGEDDPYPDLSEVSLPGVEPHEDDCIADFLLTSRSSVGLTMGGTYTGLYGTRLADYFQYKGYEATASYSVLGVFTWNSFVEEINAGRPLVFSVDSDGDGRSDHGITAIGYDSVNMQYAFYDTWAVDDPATSVDEAIRWADFHGLAAGAPWGIYGALTVHVA